MGRIHIHMDLTPLFAFDNFGKHVPFVCNLNSNWTGHGIYNFKKYIKVDMCIYLRAVY